MRCRFEIIQTTSEWQQAEAATIRQRVKAAD